MSLKDLIRARGSLKGKLTLFKKFIDEYDQDPDPYALKQRIVRFRPELENFENIQTQVEGLCEESDFATHLKERADFEEESLKCLDKAERLYRDDPNSNESIDNVSSATLIQNTQVLTSTTPINFPKLELPKFDGSLEVWPGFADSFRSAVHNDNRFSNVQKLIYLRSCLTGKAANKIESLPTTDANYFVAWDLLEKSYHDPNYLIIKHVKAFFDLPRCDKASSNTIGNISDLARKHYRALEALQRPFLESFPMYAITSKLDEETRLKWKEISLRNNSETLEDLLEFLHERQRVLDDANIYKISKSNQNKNSCKNNNKKYQYNSGQANRTNSTTFSAQARAFCQICKNNHYTQTCEEFTKLSANERLKLVEKLKLCINCLRANHTTENCRISGCKTCGVKHHTQLHDAKEETKISCLSESRSSQILLSTALVSFIGKNGQAYQARVLLDSCSQTNFKSKKLADKLDLSKKKVNTPVTGINNIITLYTYEINASVQSRTSGYTTNLPFLIRDQFNELFPSFQVNLCELDIPANVTLADPHFYKPGEIDGLLGARIFYKLMCPKQKLLSSRDAILQKTRFGWIVAGEVPVHTNKTSLICNLSTKDLNSQLTKFWEVEEFVSKKILSKEESFCENHFKTNTTRDPLTGQYTVKLPFKNNKNELGKSYDIALKRFYSLERSLDKNLNLKQQYSDFLKDYELLNHMSEREHSNELGYLPHHGVFKQSSSTKQKT